MVSIANPYIEAAQQAACQSRLKVFGVTLAKGENRLGNTDRSREKQREQRALIKL